MRSRDGASRALLLDRRGSLALLVPVAVILAAWVLYPSLRLFATGLNPGLLAELFDDWSSANVRALWNSVRLSLLSVLGAGLLGTALATLFYRFDFPLRRLLMALAALPLALPPLVGVLAFLFLYGESGILPRGLQALLGLAEVPFAFEGFWAVWLVHVYSFYVYFYLFATATLRGVDRSVLEASADLGAGGWTTFRRVLLPILRPPLVSASLLVFMLSMASFTAPLLFASTEPFLTLQIYTYKINGSLDLSAAVSSVLTIICLLFLGLLELERRLGSAPASKGAPAPPRPVRSGAARAAAVAVALVLLAFLVLPVLTIVLISFVEEGSWTFQILPERYTAANYVSLFSQADVLQPVVNSLAMASMATAANVVFGVATALLLVQGRIRGRAAIRTIAMLPFAIPGTVIAVNLIVTFNRPDPVSFGQVLVGTFWILPLAYFIRHIPLIVRSTVSALEGYDERLTEASFDLGAGPVTTFRRVMLPVVGPGILAGTLLTFVAALGEFVSSILLYTFDSRPISVEILSQLRLYDFGAAAAYSVLLMAMVAVSTLVVRRLGATPERAAASA
jgi:iron(III) transport system permease protein